MAPMALHKIKKEAFSSQTRGKYSTFDIISTYEFSIAQCKFQHLLMSPEGALLTYTVHSCIEKALLIDTFFKSEITIVLLCIATTNHYLQSCKIKIVLCKSTQHIGKYCAVKSRFRTLKFY